MNARTMYSIMIVAAALSLAACQQQSEKPAEPPAPAATQPSTEAQPAAPAMTAKPETPAPQTEAAAPPAEPAGPAMTAKPTAPKPEASTAMTAKPAAPAPKPAATAPEPAPKPKPEPSMAMTASPFNTKKCATCHAIDHDKVGPAWKTVVEKYGDAATLAKDFEAGFKERRVANSIAKWKSKEGLMTAQFNSLIKGHEKEAAHALFETVKNGKFGNY